MDISDLLKLWRVEKGSSQLAKMPPYFYSEGRALAEGDNPYDAKKVKDLYGDIVHMRQHKMLMGCLRQLQGGAKPENLLGTEKGVYDRIYGDLEAMRLGDVTEVNEEEEEAPLDKAQETLAEAAKIEEKPEQGEPEAEVAKAPEEAAGDEEVGENVVETPEEAGGERGETKPEEPENPKKEKQEEVFKEEAENKALKRVRFLRPMPAFVGPDLQSMGPFEEDQEAELDEEVAEILLKNDAVELI